MAKMIELTTNKTYATKANVAKAVDKYTAFKDLRYIVMTNEEGRFFPVFFGSAAIEAAVYFTFPVVS